MNYNNTREVGGVRIQFISEGWRKILNSQEVADLVNGIGQNIASAAGPGFEYRAARLGYGGGRVGGFVSSTTYEAMLAQATDKALTKAVHHG